jgi:hypothetical protein
VGNDREGGPYVSYALGLGAGLHFVPALREAGLGLFLGGIVVNRVPLVAGLYFGRYMLKSNPLLLFGAPLGPADLHAEAGDSAGEVGQLDRGVGLLGLGRDRVRCGRCGAPSSSS